MGGDWQAGGQTEVSNLLPLRDQASTTKWHEPYMAARSMENPRDSHYSDPGSIENHRDSHYCT